MKPRIYRRLKGLFVNMGWLSGEPFVLFKLAIGEVIEGYPEGIDTVVFLDIQVAKVVFCVGWSEN